MKKKIFNLTGFILVLMVVLGLSFGPVFAGAKVPLLGGNKPYKNLSEFATLNQVLNVGTGDTYYVDSGIGTSGLGTSWESALTTVDAAINKCTASNGDVIMVAPGHAESFTAANGFDLDVAGVTIYMLGEGSNAPTFTFADTDATIAIGAAGCKIVGGRYLAGISEVVTGISVEAAADDCTLDGLFFPEPTTSTFEFDKTIVLAAGVDRLTTKNCIAYSCDAAGATDWLDVTTGVVNGLNVVDNYIHGEYANAPIYSDQINLECLVKDNIVQNMTTGQFGIEFSAAATGSYSGNLVYTDGGTTAIDPGSMKAVGPNWIVTAIDKSPVMFPAQDDVATNFLGVDDNDNAAATTNVASNRDGSILERLEFINKYLETGTAGGLTAPANTRSLLDILGSDGTTTTGALAGSLLGAIGTNEAAADTPFASATVEDDADGSVLERLEHVQSDSDKIDAATLAVAPVAGSLGRFIASGGTALGTQLADSKSLVDALGTNGTTPVDSATSVLGAIGVNDNNNVMDTSTVVDNEDGSVFERLEHVQADSDKIDAVTLSTTPVAASLASFVASGGTSLGTQLAASKSLVDAIGTNGTTVADTATGVAGMIGVNDADNAMDTSTVVANANGSVYERLESLALSALGPTKDHPNYLAVSTGTFDTTGTWSTVAAHEIAQVTGMVKMLIIPECNTTVSSVDDTGTIALGDETTTNSLIAASTLGSGLMAAGELWVDATLTRTILTQTQLDAITFVVANGKDIGYTVADKALSGGSMTFHVWWIPLDATGLVTAGAGGAF